MRLADTSIRRPVFAAVLIIALVVIGLFSYPKVGVDLFPNVDFPIITVTVTYPGADPASMESKIADPIEEAVNTMAGIKVLRSVNLESVTQVFVQFELEVDVDQAAQDIRDRVSSILPQLPEGVDPPKVQKFDVGAAPIMSVAVSGKLAPRDLTKLADDVVKERIQRIRGVGAVDLIGGRDREIHVLIRPGDLVGFGYTVEDVASALRAQNLDMPAGRIEEGTRELTVKVEGEVKDVHDIEEIVIPTPPTPPTGEASRTSNALVHIRQVADVVDGTEEARSWSSMDGASAVALVVRKQSGSNTVAVAKQVRAELDKMRAEVGRAGATLSVPADWSTYIERSIDDVQFDLLFGGVLAVVIILFFLHDLRATLISAVAIPSSVVATFWFIQVMGFTFNNMTMLALSLSIGILIDDAIVVIENIYRHLATGKRAREAASDATSEIGLAVLATTACIVAVFVPVAFMKGIVGRFFFQFGLTVSFAVAVSALVSFTVTPMLASRLLRQHSGTPPLVFRPFAWFLDRVDGVYRRILGWALRHRLITIGAALVSLVLAVVMVSKVKAEFLPVEDRGEFQVNVELPVGSSLELTRQFVEAVGKDMRAHAPGVAHAFVTVGGGDQGQVNQAQINVQMMARHQRAFHQTDTMNWVRDRYKDVKNVTFSVVPINAVSGGGFRNQMVQFNVRGPDLDRLAEVTQKLVAELKKIPGFVDLDTTHRTGRPEVAIAVDRQRAGDLNVPISSIATTLRYFIAGDKVSELKEGLDIYDVTMELPEGQKTGIASLSNLKVRSFGGQMVDLANVVQVKSESGPAAIERQARQRQITVLANLQDLPLGEASKDVVEAAARVVPADLTSDFAGMAEVMAESFRYMGVALMLAIIFVYMLLAAQFNSFLHPFTIMLSLPLSVVGAFGALYISGFTLNIFSMIGVIMLMGLVTKNAILLVDYTNTLRERGLPMREALLEAGPVRLRPILMTTAAMVFGMLPVALALSEGGEVRAPMAVTVIGGLLTSMLLTLVVVPVVYSLFAQVVESRPMRAIGRRMFPNP
ncbi:MAG TPA: efflux RND transporter permease subunit [Kofleriaceae bacterium]|nr:efflux RND transporter permease subunit [Kofleriaceae bacterium]